MQTRQDNTRIVYVYLYTVHHFLQFLCSSPNLCRLAKVGVHNWIHNTFYDKWEKTLQLIFCNFCCSLCNFPAIQYTKDTYIKILVTCQTFILNWRTNYHIMKDIHLSICWSKRFISDILTYIFLVQCLLFRIHYVWCMKHDSLYCTFCSKDLVKNRCYS